MPRIIEVIERIAGGIHAYVTDIDETKVSGRSGEYGFDSDVYQAVKKKYEKTGV